MTNLNDSRVLLTGASGGIGEAIARELHARGAKLILSGRRADALNALAAELDARVVVADLAERAQIERLVVDAGEVDVIIANAGLPARGTFERMTPEQIETVTYVNLTAPMLLTHQALPSMLARKAGHLVFISSMAGKVPRSGSALYSANKFGLRGFAAALRQDLHGTGVGVSTVFPGFIRDAGMFAEHVATLPKGVGTSSPQDVARATAEAIEKDQGEVDVAPVPVRVAGKLSGVSPDLVALLNRRTGANQIASKQRP